MRGKAGPRSTGSKQRDFDSVVSGGTRRWVKLGNSEFGCGVFQAMIRRSMEMWRHRSTRRIRLGTFFLTIFIFVGCSTTTSQSFRVVKDSEVESSYIATDADFGKYRQLLGKDMGIHFPTSTPHSEEEIDRIRQIFRTAFFAELEGYAIVTEPGPNTLTVEASLIDMRFGTTSDVPKLRGDLSSLAKPGQLLFLMELRDSETDRVLGRAADSAGTPPMFATPETNATDWASVESAAERWAGLFRQFLDKNLSN
jgi:hypothetical protein